MAFIPIFIIYRGGVKTPFYGINSPNYTYQAKKNLLMFWGI